MILDIKILYLIADLDIFYEKILKDILITI